MGVMATGRRGERVIITAHGSYLQEASGAEIRIGDSLENNGNNNSRCAVISDPLPGNTISYSCYGMVGRYVNVVMTGYTSRLTLCEVEVYETVKSVFIFAPLFGGSHIYKFDDQNKFSKFQDIEVSYISKPNYIEALQIGND
ncbi:Leucine-rich repeat LGI family member 2 LGI1-like protein 2 [Triplophysa tibetana]|uniref:Leucine-rich repeat LGI family member 2 LGI1-like protein 2 n=1 Tax=Triplophysa tibetana TaxID=1572043 RepID=A0A5A9PQI9_9TELE|nr:Leucine-rich repeat LGI family member 2 LGI1-like protein 2 [Triplophysa tibetana]